MVHINIKKTILAVLDILLAAYLILAMTSFNSPDESAKVCTKVSINIDDKNANGFLSAQEIKNILERKHIYPRDKRLDDVSPRAIEDALKGSSFVKSADCYKTQDGHVYITVAQQLPIVRVKNVRGEDYYLDEKGGIMPNSNYTSDLIIATGYISRNYAQKNLAHLVNAIIQNDLWNSLIEQINVCQDYGVELVPRVGDHVIYIGRLPEDKGKDRATAISEYIGKKMNRLEKFYKYGLSQAGWNRYSVVNLEFDNQIICKKRGNIQ